MSEILPVILAAGRGSRLGLDNIPKSMVSIAGRPLMQTAVESLFKTAFGPLEIKVVINFKGEVIQNYFGADLEYITQNELTGNAAAINSLINQTHDIQAKHVLAIQGDDSFQSTPKNLQKLIHLHLTRQADISILTVNHPDPSSHRKEYLCDANSQVTDIIPRKSIDSHGRYTAGIYIFSGAFLEKYLPILKEATPEGKELGISKLLVLALKSHKRLFQICSHQYYVSVNEPEGLQILRQRGVGPSN